MNSPRSFNDSKAERLVRSRLSEIDAKGILSLRNRFLTLASHFDLKVIAFNSSVVDVEVFLLRHFTNKSSVRWEQWERRPFYQFAIAQVMGSLMQWATYASVFDLATDGQRPAHVSAQAFSCNERAIDVPNHQHFRSDCNHLGFSGLQFVDFDCVLPDHIITSVSDLGHATV